MRASIFFDLLKLLAVFGLLWVVFYFVPIIPDRDELKLSLEKEEQLGEYIVEEVLAHESGFSQISTPLLDSVMWAIENRLLEAIGTTDYEYKVRVIDNPAINAFALPGGYMLICSGLISFAESAEEVAAVMAHEMGHIENRHVVSKLAREFGIAILTSGDAIVLGEIGRAAASTAFDRQQERRADAFALETMYKAGINPRYLGVFFRRLKNEQGKADQHIELLSTHPHVNSRIKASFEFEIAGDFEARDFGLDWDQVRAELTAGQNNKTE